MFYSFALKSLSHRSSRGVKRKKQNVHPFIVALLNAQSVKGIKDNGVDLFL